MKSSIDTRELISIDAGGTRIQGTYHKPIVPGHSSKSDRIGIVLLNPGILPRAATGDSAVYWADSLAAQGYPTFRFDLPGLGDSAGELPAKVIDFQSTVNDGGYASVLSEITRNVAQVFNLRGVVVMGLCAGAVTALYSAATDDRIKGLVLMDPYFYVQRAITSRSMLSHWQMRVAGGIEDDADGVRSYARKIGVNLVLKLRAIQHASRYWLLRVRGEGRLPSAANLPLIRSWKRVASSGRPMLIMTTTWSKPHVGTFDYLAYLLARADRRSVIESTVIDGTTHNFAEGTGKATVRAVTEQWLSVNFPLAIREQPPATAAEVTHHDPARLAATL